MVSTRTAKASQVESGLNTLKTEKEINENQFQIIARHIYINFCSPEKLGFDFSSYDVLSETAFLNKTFYFSLQHFLKGSHYILIVEGIARHPSYLHKYASDDD